MIQDATYMAASLMHNVEQRGKSVTPGNIAYYTILHMKSGRRSYGTSTVDALGIGTQLNGRSSVNSFDEPVEESELGEMFTVSDVFSNDTEDPPQIAARKMDWEAFCAGLTGREQAVIEHLLAGKNLNAVALKFKVSLSTMQTCKNRLADLILEFMGVDILVEVRRLPGWRNDLNTTKEKVACRHERQTEHQTAGVPVSPGPFTQRTPMQNSNRAIGLF